MKLTFLEVGRRLDDARNARDGLEELGGTCGWGEEQVAPLAMSRDLEGFNNGSTHTSRCNNA